MSSPFPGMDPYLERHWLDVHARLVMYAADSLNEKLPRTLVARTEERIAIESESGDISRAAPDVRVFQPGISDPEVSRVAIAAPIKLVVELDPIVERYIRITSAADEQLITVIEFISPTNKSGAGLREYREKRSELVASGVHVVEIDLVRRGDWQALLKPHVCPAESVTDYRATIRAGGDRQSAYLFPIALRSPLPEIPIPLRKSDLELKLDLQKLLQDAYARGRYGETLDYRRPTDPPLSADDAAWLGRTLSAHRQN